MVSASEPRNPSSEIRHALGRTHGEGFAYRVDAALGTHRDHGHLAALRLDELQSRLDSELVAGIENDLDPLALEQMRGRIELAGRVWVGDLLDADDDLHACLRVCRLGIETLTHLRPNARIGPAEGARQRSEIRPDPSPEHAPPGAGWRSAGRPSVSLTPAGIGERDDPVVVPAPGEPGLP